MKIIIPSRYASSRLPGKPLADIAGEAMIVHVWRRACAVAGPDNVMVACDDQRIQDAVTLAGGQAVITAASHESGTDRIAEAARTMQLSDDDIVINVQGDEPLIPPECIQLVYDQLQSTSGAHMSTVVVPITDKAAIMDPNRVKCVMDDSGHHSGHDSGHNSGRALYFSRAPIPFDRDSDFDSLSGSPHSHYGHVGLYGYRYWALKKITEAPVHPLEALEKLEQLRALAMGLHIQVGIFKGTIPRGVDTPEDLEAVRESIHKEKMDRS